MAQTCQSCGNDLYNSPNPDHAGEKEHYCKTTKGIVFGTGTKVVSESKSKKTK